MNLPESLIDKHVTVISKIPEINGRLDPTDIKRINVNYFDHEIAVALSRYPNSYMIKHLTDMMQELKLDVINLRNHILWEHTEGEAL